MRSKAIKVFEKFGLPFGRMIYFSKSDYLEMFPNHRVVFNARIYKLETYEKEKDSTIKDFFRGQEIEIWYGDLDLHRDMEALQSVANEIGNIVITYESGRYIETIRKLES